MPHGHNFTPSPEEKLSWLMESAVKKQEALKGMSQLALGCRSSQDSVGALLLWE
jgi:hypothetical protein